MKKNILYKSLSAALLLSMASCNDIDTEERFIELPPIEGDRVVLIEDYTGQGCPNCPEGHRALEQFEQQYPGKVITVSIHAGEFAIPATETRYVGLMPDFAEGMKNDRGVETYPTVIIDGALNDGRPATWAAPVRDALAVAATCDIDIADLVFDPSTRRLTGNVILTSGKSAAGTVGIWILEDGIVARQYNVNDDHKWDRNYVHDNILRGYATTSPWGDPVTLTREEPTTRAFATVLDTSWKPENISVVVFVTDMSSGAYLQAARAYINVVSTE